MSQPGNPIGGDPSALAAMEPIVAIPTDDAPTGTPPPEWGGEFPDLDSDPAVEVTEV